MKPFQQVPDLEVRNVGKNKILQAAAVCDLEQSLLAEASEGLMEPGQCRAARALLQWTQKELGRRARVSDMTIRQFELGVTKPIPVTVEALQRALEKVGIEFINDDKPGVRMRRRRK